MSGRNSITVFLPGLHGGGAEKMMLDLCEAFVGYGHDVDLVVAAKEGQFADRVPTEVTLVDLDAPALPGFNLLGALPGLIQHLRSRRPDVLLSALTRANIVGSLATLMPGVDTRLILSEHNHFSTYIEHATQREQVVLPMLVSKTYPNADKVLCVSRGVETDIKRVAKLNDGSTAVVYNAVLTPEIRQRYTEPVSHPWLQAETPVVMGLGSLTVQKDFPTLIRAVQHLRDHCDCRLLICGSGERRAELESLVRDLGMEDVVDLTGFVDNPYAMLNHADVFALSSKWEGFGNVIVEALGCGCPVVSTDCPSGPAEILADGEYGSLVPVGDPEALATAIRSQLDDPHDADRLRARAEDFSVETISEQYLDLLLDC